MSSSRFNSSKQLEKTLIEKEGQWLLEKEKLKQKEQEIHTQLIQRQSSFSTRLKALKETQAQEKEEEANNKKLFEKKLHEKENKLSEIEKEKKAFVQKTKNLEEQVEQIKKQLEDKEQEIKNLNKKIESDKVDDFSAQTKKLSENKGEIADVQITLEQQKQQIIKMQNSLQAHTKLAAALKVEKDNAIKYSERLRNILEEAREEIKHKSKIIYRVHEKLVLRDRMCEKLKSKLKEYESNSYDADKWDKIHCQVCSTTTTGNKSTGGSSTIDSEVGKMHICPQYVSESLIGMSVRKVHQLRTRLNNLKKRQSSDQKKKNYLKKSDHSVLLSRQLELGGKLYQALQDHADQSCEDFINLLKLTVSQSGKKEQHYELNPSNDTDDTLTDGDDVFSDISKCVRFNSY